ncbi:MAG: hypothetical protein ABIQ32_02800 [Sphingomicrobium sp.]
MHRCRFLLFVGLSIQCAAGSAQTTIIHPVPAKRQLGGLSATEASALLAKVKEAQNRLRGGEFLPFELLAGSLASYEATKVSPRDAFLAVPFDEVLAIQRVRTDNLLWQPYKLAYAPKGLGQLYWDIEVVLGINGNIERVLMIYKPPAPF